jgi:hypothetical protein
MCARLAQQPQIAAKGLGPRRRRGRFQFPAGHDPILPGQGTQNQDHRSAASLYHPVRRGAESAGRSLAPWNIRHAALHSLAVARVRDPPFCTGTIPSVPSAGDVQNGPFGAGGLSMMVRRMERVLGSVHGMLWSLVPQVESCDPSGRADS